MIHGYVEGRQARCESYFHARAFYVARASAHPDALSGRHESRDAFGARACSGLAGSPAARSGHMSRRPSRHEGCGHTGDAGLVDLWMLKKI